MAHLEGFLSMDHRCCSMMPALDKFLCSSAIPAIHPCCRSSFTMHPAWITKTLAPLWCQRIGRCLPSLGPAWPRLSMSQRSAILAKNVPVLVRGEHDGFYYHGTVKEEMENEREMFLVEFTRPLQLHGRHSVCVQKTAKDDILEYANGMKHSLLPGDKVLAPWEPDLVRYGPGTILTGIETRDPLRASEDEEIVVQFWNNKKVKLPQGVALWIPPSLCERIVEMIHMPFSSRLKRRESPDANSCIFSCSPKTTWVPVCVAHSNAKHSLLCSPCWPLLHCRCGGMCCSSACVRCFCCCHGHFDVWWPLPPKSQVIQREAEEAEPSSKSSPRLLEVEGPKQEELAALAARSPSDSEGDPEVFPNQSAVMDSTVKTDPSRSEKSRLEESARPKWKYWKRNHYKSRASNSGTGRRSSICTKGKLESKAISVVDMSHVAPPEQNAVLETTEQPPRGQFTMNEKYQDFKLSSGEEGSVASGKQRYRGTRKKTESDNKHKATCLGKDKLGSTDCISREQRGKEQQSSC
ncbi:uncharacterized protein C11orf16 homolog isoform X2 [Meleagris gallopavo]|uniref:uncharacterized protein C11orf16 homolog isoform X2 n=1 Tax=Meleagris gallopavo TaxID=9103 RepID=UPI00093D6EC6|nr:uncharacterized protein C11orf16 homolog isoform X2 [Meleagris gallopavo]XP_019470878.1 uncharacterized protein C11orf16 homolog isoform X2 [Meleagris gallopavo]